MAPDISDRRPPEEGEPLSSPRSIKSEHDFDVDPIPVICTLKEGLSNEQVPAVQARHPSVGCAVFPLNRIELGDIWSGQAKTHRWDIKPVSGGWDKAFERFSKLIKYPPEFLRPTLEVLRKQTYLDKTPLSWTQWSFTCKNTSPKLYAVAKCHVCDTPRYLSMRLLNAVNRSLDEMQCKVLGAKCGEGGDHIHDTFDDLLAMELTSPFPRSGFSTSRYQTASERRGDFPKANGKMFELPNSEDEFDSPKIGTANHAFRTIPPSPKGSHTITQDYCTWSDVKKKQRRHRRKKAPSDSEDSDTDDDRDPLNDVLALSLTKELSTWHSS